MATTTSNFSWPIPQSTDLVKDGATAIASLGSGIDTSMADLKGGTTGQVLSKASNTDMDFTWVAQDDSNAIQNAIVDAKGDLITATAADTPARLAVGSNNAILVPDSAESTGLKWQTPSWTSWTPTVVNGLTTGNGTMVAKYLRIGNLIYVEGSFTLGSTSAITSFVQLSLPVTADNAITTAPIGNSILRDAGTAYYYGNVWISSTTAFEIATSSVNATYPSYAGLTSTVPFTWTNTDYFTFQFVYKAA